MRPSRPVRSLRRGFPPQLNHALIEGSRLPNIGPVTGTPDSPQDRPLTQVLHAYAEGDEAARDLLVERTYAEIKRIAAGQLGGRSSTLQPTAVANEAFVKLFHGTDLRPADRAQFFGLAAKVIRDLLVDHFRAKRALRRGGDQARVTLRTEPGTESAEGVDALDLCEALEELQQLDARQHEIVELKFFTGLQMTEIAEMLGHSLSTIEREWRAARAWLSARLRDD